MPSRRFSVLDHSFRLNAFPNLKMAFWKELLMSKMLADPYDEEIIDDWLWVIQDESFPVFRVNMNRKGRMNDTHMDVLFAFFTMPSPHELDVKFEQECAALARRNKLIPVGFVIGQNKVMADCLRRIQDLLDCVFASPGRVYEINLLDISKQRMDAPRLELVAEILDSNQSVYRIPYVRLAKIVKGKKQTDEVSEALDRVIVAVLPTTSFICPYPDQSCALTTLHLGKNIVGLQHVAAVCSALRYGHSMSTLNLDSILDRVSKADREQSWRWLASASLSRDPSDLRQPATAATSGSISTCHTLRCSLATWTLSSRRCETPPEG